MVSLRLHDHQHRAPGLWRFGQLPRSRPGPPAAPRDRRLRPVRGAVRHQCDRLFRSGGAAAVQRARGDLGPTPTPLPARSLCAADGALLLRRDLRRPRAHLLRRAGRAGLSGRSARRRDRRPRYPGALVPGDAGSGPADRRRAWFWRGRAREPRRYRRVGLVAGGGLRHRGSPDRARHTGLLDRAPPVTLQEPEPGTDNPRCQDRGAALEPARSAFRRAQPDHSVPSRARAQPRQPDRAGRADRRVHRRRGAEPDHGVRWRPRAARLSRLHPRGAALRPARAPHGADPGRGRRRRRSAGTLSRRRQDRCGRARPAVRRPGAGPLRRLRRPALPAPGGQGSCRRGARLRRRKPAVATI